MIIQAAHLPITISTAQSKTSKKQNKTVQFCIKFFIGNHATFFQSSWNTSGQFIYFEFKVRLEISSINSFLATAPNCGGYGFRYPPL